MNCRCASCKLESEADNTTHPTAEQNGDTRMSSSATSSKTVCLWALITCLVLWTAPAHACSVPVFRWALERWEADPYEVVVFHQGPMEPAEQAVVDQLTSDATANVAVRLVDLAEQPGDQTQALLERYTSLELPWVMVRYPAISMIKKDVWAGSLNDAALKTALDSPKRRDIAQRLIDGDAAVWVLLESGEKEKDDAAAKLLTEQLGEMQEMLKLPEQSVDLAYTGWNTPTPPDLPISFSLLRLSRAEASERMFVRMLLHSEPDLTTFEEPMAFPILGRGRALYALVGAGINEDNVAEACTFLVGACTCQVKQLNPGTDLLMAVDWDRRIEDKLVTELEVVPFPALAETVEAQPDLPPAVASNTLVRSVLFVAALQMVIVAAATFILLKRKRAARRP